MSIKKAIVLAGGKGSRLMPLTQAMPKEMIRIGQKPVIEHVIEALKVGGIEEVLVVVGRKKEIIMDHLGSGVRLGVDIFYKIQEEPLGTAHALLQGERFVDKDFVLMYGDNYFKPPEAINQILHFHELMNADATLAVYPVDDPRMYGIVKGNEKNEVTGIIEKPTLEEAKEYKINDFYYDIAGLMVLKKDIFDCIRKTVKLTNCELCLTDSVEVMRKNGYKILAYPLHAVVRYDTGTFESLIKAEKYEWIRI